jgi:hypothetical protein
MSFHRIALATAGLMTLSTFSPQVVAEDSKVPNAPTTLATWSEFIKQLAPIEQRMLAALPERLRNNPEALQGSYQLMLAALARTSIDALIGDRSYPMFVPEINIAINLYQPNADTIYKSALIEPGGTYRLRGKRGTVLYNKLGELGPDMIRTGKPSAALGYHDIDELKLDAQGRFDVIISPTRPKDYSGDWWQLNPKTEKLMLRQIAYDWSKEEDPSISIDRLDAPTGRSQPSAAEMSARLAELPTMIGNASTFFVDHVEALRREGYLNKLKVFDVSNMSGLAGQSYYEGAYEITDDEALIVKAKVPVPCRYWSLILTNDLYQTTDWYNNQSSLNGAQAIVDKDGLFRIVISARDPGVHNWLDTAGNASGAIQGRWLDCAGPTPMPEVEKVPLSKVRSALPPDTVLVTPAQRDAAIRDRRASVQQRRLW